MIRTILIAILVLLVNVGNAQTKIEWSPEVELGIANFKSEQTEINSDLESNFVQTGAYMNFNYQMSSYEFMFTKNFNSKVSTEFVESAAVISAVDSTTADFMVDFVQYNFDLTELYARKFRKEIYEEKGAFSSSDFFLPIFEKYQKELTSENARVSKLTELGKKSELLKSERQRVLKEIEILSDYCKSCKPPKSKKKRN
ncbi:hypothetical protein [Fulvivirga lutea]|uniref:Uncharacterized protein n=1 Tax=Fulvivirga lutea TaxID=2810512 RepID=A0A974WID0_9BACT|nr:hypothetical protein [Fulvivirga lutea]QSE99104.1 hypothetical protein JR347_08455 [Fulvivirga lutea]